MKNSISILLVLSAIILAVQGGKAPAGILEDSTAVETISAVGQKVLLPCSVATSSKRDRPIMVLIYQGDNKTPAYSLDARNGSLETGEPWSDKDVFHRRATFFLGHSTSGLELNPVKSKDEGNYRCRVDFKDSPTRNSKIKLKVIVPPQMIQIITEEGTKAGGKVGPYVEGNSLTLRCKVIGGRPRPRVTWFQGEQMLDNESEVNQMQSTENILHIVNLKRSHLNQNFTCHALNSNFTNPIEHSVQLDMIFPIQNVTIFGTEDPIQEGIVRKLICKAVGSRPNAIITWYQNGKEIKSNFEKEIDSGKAFKSSVIIIPKMKNDDDQIVCRATNPSHPTSVLEDTRHIKVLYSPRLNLVAGKGLNLKNIKENDDVYFECEIQANPRTQLTLWFYQDEPLLHNLSQRIIHSNQSLVLQSIKKERTGRYHCSALNKYGNGTSNHLDLKVKYAPLCPHADPMIFGAEKFEEIKIPCQSKGNPKPFSYEWAFNSSSELVDISEIADQKNRVIEYIPTEDSNFGTLLCWARNEVSKQKIPCLYHVIHSSLPEPVKNCNINISSVSVKIDCEEGWDGGIDQTFTLQLITKNRKLSKITQATTTRGNNKGDPRALANTSVAPRPSFVLNNLKPGVKYLVEIAAVNKKGRSSPKNFSFITPTDKPERQISQDFYSIGNLNWPFIGCVLVGVLGLILVIVGTALGIKAKYFPNRRRSVSAEVALERRRNKSFQDREELMERLTVQVEGPEGSTHVRDDSL